MISSRIVFYTLFITMFWQQSTAVPDHRAQVWKPYRTLRNDDLLINQIKFVVLPDLKSGVLRATVEDFLNLVDELHHVRPKIITVGYPKYSLSFQSIKQGFQGGSFKITRKRSRVIIRAASVEGWCNGLYAIMEDLLGARWYWEGALGLEMVEPKLQSFLYLPWYEKPAFVQRSLVPVANHFARRNRLNSAFNFNHNLAQVFTPELYQARPEAFSKVNGRRRAPLGNEKTDPQPNFTEPISIEIAAQSVLDFFKSNPNSKSFSLSINDNVLFDTSPSTELAVGPVRYFRGRPDYTDLVFDFMNRVAQRVFDQGGAWQTAGGEDRYLTALAYYWTEAAPTVALHPRVMPVLTSDRAQWHDPVYRAEDKALVEAWVASGAERVATWDYYFGTPYLYPRQFNQWIAESLPYMADVGIDVFFSQLPNFWGLDGAKAWFASKLLWDPKQDTKALLDEYYQNFFGLAANPMRSFYEMAEMQRNAHEGAAEWIKFYKDESGVALFSQEILSAMRAYLDEADLLVRNDARRHRRVEVVSRAFRLTELYYLYDTSRRELLDFCFNKEDQQMITSSLEVFQQSRDNYEVYVEQYSKDEYAPPRRQIELAQSDPEAIALRIVQANTSKTFRSIVPDSALKHKAWYKANFLGPSLPWLSDWQLNYRPSENFKLAASIWGSGGSGLRISDADIISISRTFSVTAKKNYEFHIRASWRISPDNRTFVHVKWQDPSGRILKSRTPLRLPSSQMEEPVEIIIPLCAPENSTEIHLQIVACRQSSGDIIDISALDFGSIE